MSNRRFEMYQYRQVLVRIRQGDSNRTIARSGLMGRNKVAEVRLLAQEQGWLNPDRPLPDDTELAQHFDQQQPLPSSCISSLEPWRIQITEWHAAGIAGTTICSALTRNHGFKGSYSAVHRFVRQLVEAQLPEVPLRLCFQAGEAAQVDFGAGPAITDTQTGEIFKTWFFVMTLCWSRHQYAEMVRDQSIATWLSCHRRAFEWFGGVPSRIIIDNPKCAITKACIYDPVVQRAYAEYAEGYTFKIDPCPPRDPQKKGIVESGVKYIKRSFLPLREFRSLAEANQQLQEWVLGV
jgi:Integrase core domain